MSDLALCELPPIGDWRGEAACRVVGPNFMFPENSGTAKVELRRAQRAGAEPTELDRLQAVVADAQRGEEAAKLICTGCSVLEECREYALAARLLDDDGGVWGGLTSRERFNVHAAEKKRIWREQLAASGRKEKGRVSHG